MILSSIIIDDCVINLNFGIMETIYNVEIIYIIMDNKCHEIRYLKDIPIIYSEIHSQQFRTLVLCDMVKYN